MIPTSSISYQKTHVVIQAKEEARLHAVLTGLGLATLRISLVLSCDQLNS